MNQPATVEPTWTDQAVDLPGRLLILTDSQGVTWRPFLREGAIGWRLVHPDGRERYVVLNPSSDDSDSEAPTSTVFLYESAEPDWTAHGQAVTYLAPFAD